MDCGEFISSNDIMKPELLCTSIKPHLKNSILYAKVYYMLPKKVV